MEHDQHTRPKIAKIFVNWIYETTVLLLVSYTACRVRSIHLSIFSPSGWFFFSFVIYFWSMMINRHIFDIVRKAKSLRSIAIHYSHEKRNQYPWGSLFIQFWTFSRGFLWFIVIRLRLLLIHRQQKRKCARERELDICACLLLMFRWFWRLNFLCCLSLYVQ